MLYMGCLISRITFRISTLVSTRSLRSIKSFLQLLHLVHGLNSTSQTAANLPRNLSELSPTFRISPSLPAASQNLTLTAVAHIFANPTTHFR